MRIALRILDLPQYHSLSFYSLGTGELISSHSGRHQQPLRGTTTSIGRATRTLTDIQSVLGPWRGSMGSPIGLDGLTGSQRYFFRYWDRMAEQVQ